MGDCPEAATWNHAGPRESGFYEVRPCAHAWDLESHAPCTAPSPRMVQVDVPSGRFDAKTFGGNIHEPLWEWRGPIRIPSGL